MLEELNERLYLCTTCSMEVPLSLEHIHNFLESLIPDCPDLADWADEELTNILGG